MTEQVCFMSGSVQQFIGYRTGLDETTDSAGRTTAHGPSIADISTRNRRTRRPVRRGRLHRVSSRHPQQVGSGGLKRHHGDGFAGRQEDSRRRPSHTGPDTARPATFHQRTAGAPAPEPYARTRRLKRDGERRKHSASRGRPLLLHSKRFRFRDLTAAPAMALRSRGPSTTMSFRLAIGH
jgi:hypothetical protein